MRVGTKDLIPFDRVRREAAGDDSGEESDWLDRTGHPKGHIKTLGAKSANRALLDNGRAGFLPAAYATDESRRTECQKLSYDKQNPGCATSTSVKLSLIAKDSDKDKNMDTTG